VEGTVTISLKDYEKLKGEAEKSDHYLELAARNVELLEKIAEFLHGEKIAEGLGKEIDKELEKWYGYTDKGGL
jgi:small nuclear ribonucleoprotein (snRNP)-like protein